MLVEHDKVDDVLLLRPIGRIDSSSSCAFEEQCAKLIGTDAKKVVVDLSNIDYISSAGLRVLLISAKKVKYNGGTLTLSAASESVKEVICVSGFDLLLGAHETVAEAVAALKLLSQ